MVRSHQYFREARLATSVYAHKVSSGSFYRDLQPRDVFFYGNKTLRSTSRGGEERRFLLLISVGRNSRGGGGGNLGGKFSLVRRHASPVGKQCDRKSVQLRSALQRSAAPSNILLLELNPSPPRTYVACR